MMRIVFMGTPDFALPSLKALIGYHHLPVAVVTQRDRPKGRGHRSSPPPVKVAAEASGIPVLQPEKMNDGGFLQKLRDLNPDLIIVVAYGKILPPEVLNLPKFGCVNVHASLLPKYRGAAPIAWAIINGETQTGVTTMRMDQGLDTGDIYRSETVQITPIDTAGTLAARLSEIGAELLLKTIDGIERGSISSAPQDHSRATEAPLLRKENGEIDWSHPAERIASLVRGLDPWPGAYTFYEEELWKLWKVSIKGTMEPKKAGEIIQVNPDYIGIATGHGIVCIQELQPANAKRMSARQYLAGHDVEEGVVLGE